MHAEVVSARPAIAGTALPADHQHRMLFFDHQPPSSLSSSTTWDHQSMVEKAAEVLAKNPEIGTCQLRLQAALQKSRVFEEKYDRVMIDYEKVQVVYLLSNNHYVFQ